MKQKVQKPTTNNREGAMLLFVAVLMVFIFVAVTIGVDVARMHLTRAELQAATDASARAGVEALGRTQNEQAGIDAALEVARLNRVAGKPLRLNREDIEIGTAEEVESGKFEFSPGGTILTSVRVNGHRDDNSLDGPVGLLFGPLFGVTDFSPSLISAATSTERDIALVLDVSGSMGTDNRFESLADALDSFLAVLEATPQEERISLSVYETTARKIQPVTSDLNLIREAFADEVASGNTAIGLGLRSGLDSLLNDPESRPFAFKSIVVMTDGKHNTAVDPEVAAQECRDESVTVITVTFSEGADRTRMQTVANIANGEHFHANSGSELDDAFTQIARQLAVLIIE